MFLEIAEIRVTDPAGFEAAVAAARPLFLSSPGCHGLSLHRVVETPDLYRLVVEWATIEDHTVTFRGSEAFTKWRALIGGVVAGAPTVTHSQEVALG